MAPLSSQVGEGVFDGSSLFDSSRYFRSVALQFPAGSWVCPIVVLRALSFVPLKCAEKTEDKLRQPSGIPDGVD